MPGAEACAAAENEKGVGAEESTVALPGRTCAATGTSATLQPRALGPSTALPTERGIDFISPQTEPGPTDRVARALSATFPVCVTKTGAERETGVFARRSSVQLAVGASTPAGSTSSTVVPGASSTLTTVTVSVAHSLAPGGCDSASCKLMGVLG